MSEESPPPTPLSKWWQIGVVCVPNHYNTRVIDKSYSKICAYKRTLACPSLFFAPLSAQASISTLCTTRNEKQGWQIVDTCLPCGPYLPNQSLSILPPAHFSATRRYSRGTLSVAGKPIEFVVPPPQTLAHLHERRKPSPYTTLEMMTDRCGLCPKPLQYPCDRQVLF